MAFDALTKPKKGIRFWLLSCLIDINWARTWTWAELSDEGRQMTTRYLSLHVTERYFDEGILKAVTLIVGPVKLMIGLR